MNGPSADRQPVAPPPPAHDGVRRLQIGIAGVLTVLLLVGMAGLIGERARERAALGVDEASDVKVAGADAKSGSVPLEELGVQAVSKDQGHSAKPAPSALATGAPASAAVPDLEPDPELERARQSKR